MRMFEREFIAVTDSTTVLPGLCLFLILYLCPLPPAFNLQLGKFFSFFFFFRGCFFLARAEFGVFSFCFHATFRTVFCVFQNFLRISGVEYYSRWEGHRKTKAIRIDGKHRNPSAKF